MVISASSVLKEQIADRHQQANKTSFMSRLVTGRIGLQEYVTYLRALSILYSVLETQLSQSTDRIICAIWHPEMRKLHLLQDDIYALQGESWQDLNRPINAALRGAQLIRVRCLANHWHTLGSLYVLEGSTNGGLLIYPRVQQALKLAGGTGTKYLRNYQDDQNRIWQEFKRRVNRLICSDEALASAVAGAQEIFDVLITIMQGFDEHSPDHKIHATAINPEAGNHKVPQLEQEIQAVLLASESSCKIMPYIEARYGHRGKKFTESDGAWLATLADLPEPTVIQQTDWLARFLSSIGLPRITLEIHLQETEKNLVRLLPDQAQKYAKLRYAAEHLAMLRDQVIEADIQADVIKRFYRQVGALEKTKSLAEILVSAKADEVIDHSTALRDILNWLDGSTYWPATVKHAANELACELESQ